MGAEAFDLDDRSSLYSTILSIASAWDDGVVNLRHQFIVDFPEVDDADPVPELNRLLDHIAQVVTTPTIFPSILYPHLYFCMMFPMMSTLLSSMNHQVKGSVCAWKWTNSISPNTRRNLGTFLLLEVSLSVMLVLKTRNSEILRWALITFLQFPVHKWEWQASLFMNPNVLLYVNTWFWYRPGSIFHRTAEMYHQHKSLRDYLSSLPSWENKVPMMAFILMFAAVCPIFFG